MDEGHKTEYGTYRDGTFIAMNSDQLSELARQEIPAFPVPKSPDGSINKTKFISDLLMNHLDANGRCKYTANSIAKMVQDKFGGDIEKALSFTRSVPWHLKQKGITAKYKRESEVDDEPAIVPAPTVAQT